MHYRLTKVKGIVYPYTEGTIQYDRPKIGRNVKCPCESGLKYKRCCQKGSEILLEKTKEARNAVEEAEKNQSEKED